MGVESVFVGCVEEVVGIGVFATVEKGVGTFFQHTDIGVDVHAVDDKLFADKGVEQREVEFGGVDGIVDIDGRILCAINISDEPVAGVEEGVVLGEDVLFGIGKMGVGEGEALSCVETPNWTRFSS